MYSFPGLHSSTPSRLSFLHKRKERRKNFSIKTYHLIYTFPMLFQEAHIARCLSTQKVKPRFANNIWFLFFHTACSVITAYASSCSVIVRFLTNCRVLAKLSGIPTSSLLFRYHKSSSWRHISDSLQNLPTWTKRWSWWHHSAHGGKMTFVYDFAVAFFVGILSLVVFVHQKKSSGMR